MSLGSLRGRQGTGSGNVRRRSEDARGRRTYVEPGVTEVDRSVPKTGLVDVGMVEEVSEPLGPVEVSRRRHSVADRRSPKTGSFPLVSVGSCRTLSGPVRSDPVVFVLGLFPGSLLVVRRTRLCSVFLKITSSCVESREGVRRVGTGCLWPVPLAS